MSSPSPPPFLPYCVTLTVRSAASGTLSEKLFYKKKSCCNGSSEAAISDSYRKCWLPGCNTNVISTIFKYQISLAPSICLFVPCK